MENIKVTHGVIGYSPALEWRPLKKKKSVLEVKWRYYVLNQNSN